MRDIKNYIKTYMEDRPFCDIEDYICSFLQEGKITDEECDALLEWAKKWYEIR